MPAIAVVITACSILFSGPIDNSSPALQNGTCREFKEIFQPEYTPYGSVDQPITIDKPIEGVTPAQCVMNGQIVINKWKDQHPNFILNKWRCENNTERQDI
jgi:hypothetical protein